jgi:hypothetical protein
VIGRQVLARAIFLDPQPMGGRQMPAQHAALLPTIQAHDITAVNGSPNGNRRGSPNDGFWRRSTELSERLMNGRDQGAELIRRELVASEIRADDLLARR